MKKIILFFIVTTIFLWYINYWTDNIKEWDNKTESNSQWIYQIEQKDNSNNYNDNYSDIVKQEIKDKRNKIWVSESEILLINTDSCWWKKVVDAANQLQVENATIENKDSNNNVQALAASLVYLKTGNQEYKKKVISSIETLIKKWKPNSETLSWAREIGSYVIAADIVWYYSDDFNVYLDNVSKKWIWTDNRTLTDMYYSRPNNWWMHAFASLLIIHLYLDEYDQVEKIRNNFLLNLSSWEKTSAKYWDLHWQNDENNPVLINQVWSIKEWKDISGFIPDEMRRWGDFVFPPNYTNYPWEFLQWLIVSAYILDRQNMSIWEVEDRAILRSVVALQDTLWWTAQWDDIRLLKFIDNAYGTEYSDWYDECDSRIMKHWKNAGWPIILWN